MRIMRALLQNSFLLLWVVFVSKSSTFLTCHLVNNVAMPLPKEHQRVQVKFMQVIGLKPAAIRAHLIRAHGAQALSLPTIYRWFRKFEAGRTEVTDAQ